MKLTREEKNLLQRMQDGKIKRCEIATIETKRALVERGFIKLVFNMAERTSKGFRITDAGREALK